MTAVSLLAACGSAATALDPGDPPDLVQRDPHAPLDPLDLARRIHREVNRTRRVHGLQPLAWNPALHPIALRHSEDMVRRGYFAHDSPEGDGFGRRYNRAGFQCKVPVDERRWLAGAENLAAVWRMEGKRRWSDGREEIVGPRHADEIARRTVQEWLDSPPHRANLLKAEWRTEAIGVVVDREGKVVATQNFC
jgi:uncharacterized protein YkwD